MQGDKVCDAPSAARRPSRGVDTPSGLSDGASMTKTPDVWLLYGANGYTGALIAEEAARRGMRPILAGRREEPVRALAERLGFESRVFPLDDAAALRRALGGVQAILLAAGPFSATSEPVRRACLAGGVHYLDITGEIDVLEACRRDGDAAARAGVTLLPGVGFDVVPTDCLAASLHARLPTPTHLRLAIHSRAGASAGTAKTMLDGLVRGGAGMVRRGGQLVGVPVAYETRIIPFPDKPRFAVTVPWGDLATAHLSTGIPNIEVYFTASRRQVQALRAVAVAQPILRLPGVPGLLAKLIGRTIRGPGPERRARARTSLWGSVSDATGAEVQGALETLEGYHLTMLTAVTCMERVLQGKTRPGMQTPSQAFGADFIAQIPGCRLEVPVSAAVSAA